MPSHQNQKPSKHNKLKQLKPTFFSDHFELSLITAFLLGAFSILSLPPYSFWPAMLVGIAGLYFIIGLTQKTAGSSQKTLIFAIGWSYGFGYFFFGLSWVGNALLVDGNPYKWLYPIALCILPAILSLFHGIAALIIGTLSDMKKLYGLLFFAAIYTVSDWARGTFFTGFPWNLFGHTWSNHIEMAQFASIAGVYGLSFITLLCFATAGYLALNWRHNKSYRLAEKISLCSIAAAALIMMATLYVYGQARLSSNPTEFNNDVTVAIIQPNIQQDKKWDEKQKDFNFYRQLNTTLLAAQQSSVRKHSDKIHSSDLPSDNIYSPHTLVIWPETSFYSEYLNESYRLAAVSNTLKLFPSSAYLIAGAVMRDIEDDLSVNYYNSLFVFSADDNQIISQYNKHHLVPFGEYIPLNNLFDIGTLVGFSPFTPGAQPMTLVQDRSIASNIKTLENRILDSSNEPLKKYTPFIPLICYESIFTHQLRHAWGHGKRNNTPAQIMINITNDAWFGDSAGPYQHLSQSRMRSIEMGLPLARAANTGISALYDSYGREIFIIKYNNLHYGLSFLPKPSKFTSFYSKHGNIQLFLIITIISIATTIIKIRDSLN